MRGHFEKSALSTPGQGDAPQGTDRGYTPALPMACRPLSPPMGIKAVQDEPRHVLPW